MFSAMEVKLAQVFSQTLESARSYAYRDAVDETAKFILIMNQWFDAMSTKHLNEARQKQNPELEPFLNVNNIWLEWLEMIS